MSFSQPVSPGSPEPVVFPAWMPRASILPLDAPAPLAAVDARLQRTSGFIRVWPVVYMCVMGVGLLGLLLAWYFTRESALLAAAAFVVAYWVYQYLSGRRKRSGANSGRSYGWQTPKPAPEAAPSNGQATPSGGEVVTNTVNSTFNGSTRSATYSIQRRRDTNAQVDPSTGRLVGENLFGNNLTHAH